MTLDMSRRRFLKITAETLGLAAAVGPASAAFRKDPSYQLANLKGEIKKIPTFCDICFWKCGAIAYTKGGELWKIEGNPQDPLSRGRLCPRGTGGIGLYRDPNRLRAPLLRTKKRGEDAWAQVTWNEAFDFIAEKMLTIKDKYGPEAMAMFSHGLGGKFLKRTLKAYGTPNITAPSFAQCRGPRDVGFKLTYGHEVGSPECTDIRNSKCLVLIGSHLGENMHNTQVQEFAEAIENNCSIIVVDPRFSVAAGKAKHFLPIKPGTDIALLLAWMNVLVEENLYDKEYVESYGFGFDAFKETIKAYTPEWAYPETTINPEQIRVTAREMARNAPATLIHPGRHATWYGDDAQRSRAIALLNALLGSWGRKGGFYTANSMDLPADEHPPYPESKKGKVDNPNNKYPFATTTITTGIREATITGKPYPVKGWLVYATNLIHALPNEQETLRAIQELDLLVTVDVIPTEINGWADVVLPESIYLERHDDVNVEWFRDPFIGYRQPVISSPYDQKPNWWIARELAKRLGHEDFFAWETLEDSIKDRITRGGYDFNTLKKEGIIHGERQPIYFDEGVPAEFPTPSGKIEFYSTQLKDAGFDPVPVYNKPEEPQPGFFRLLYGRAPVHSFSRTQSNPLLADMMEENEVHINADIAKKYGLSNGDRIKLKNQDGVISDSIRVRATETIRTDCVYMVHGFGHKNPMLKTAYRKGASDAELITRYKNDPLMGGTGMNVNFVTFIMEDA